MSSDAFNLDRRGAVGLTRIALVVAALGFATILGAWAFEWAGYTSCELCLKERIPYYAGIPLALLVAALASRGRAAIAATGFIGLALIFGAGATLSAYHAGIEWKLWPGPASCTGSYAPPADVHDFFNQLKTASAVRCDEAALRILGISLAGWDCLVCLVLTTFAVVGATRAARS